jgi:hypothetical protein
MNELRAWLVALEVLHMDNLQDFFIIENYSYDTPLKKY